MTTDLQVTQTSPREVNADAIIIGVVQGPDGPVLAPGSEDVDAAFGGTLTATLTTLGATGAQDEVTKVASGGTVTAPLVVAAGLGPVSGQQPADPESLRRAAGSAVRSVSRLAGHVAVALPARDADEAEAATLGALLGGYQFSKYRSDAKPGVQQITLIAGEHAADAADRARVIAEAMSLVRDLVNTTAADLYPETFAARAREVAQASGLGIEVLDEKALDDGGYGGLTNVGRGSARPPRLVRLAYSAADAAKTVVLVGKGITFDTGGLSLKPSTSMEAMKTDMSGAAAVLGAMQIIAALRPSVNVIGYLALAENMPGGKAQRPSDVIRMYGGKTVEVLNTDAEGRLVLADGLARSAQDNPDLVVDIATLTGAQVVALGRRISGVMSSDPKLSQAIVDSAGRAGEMAWPMPLPEHLRKGLDSMVADLANVASAPGGGMLTAGLFLKEFAPAGVRWAHLDIAGPANHDGEPYGYIGKGGTGAGTRMLVQIALDEADGKL